MSKARGLADLGNVYSDGALSHRNVIINGGMQVNQRNGGAAVTVGGSPVFVADRFHSQNTTTTGTITGQQSTLGNSSSFKLIATSAVTNLTTTKYVYGLIAVLEAQDVYHLNGNTVTLSFTVETNWAGNLPVTVRNFNSTRSYVADVTVVSGVNNVAVSIPLEAGTVDAIDNGIGLTLVIGFNNEATYQTATTDAWVAGNFLTSTSSTQWAKTTGNFINITNLQLEAGDTATPFEHRSYADELARCQRYYEQINAEVNYSLVGVGVGISTTVVLTEVKYSKKRTAPSISGTGDFVCYVGVDRAVTSVAFHHITSTRCTGSFVSTGIVAGGAYKTQFHASGDRNIKIDAEL